VQTDKKAFIRCFQLFYAHNDPLTASRLYQQHGNRFLVHNPPAYYLSRTELDRVYDLNFEREQHPYYEKQGSVRALETIRFSIATHRGCYGECNFCAIAMHEGRTVRRRSEASILKEALQLSRRADFKGYILDVGGPTANMYGYECDRKLTRGSCRRKRCLYPEPCPRLPVDHGRQIRLLQKLRNIKGIKKIFVASGIRYDLILNDPINGRNYLKDIIRHHLSGQMKIAPEHTEAGILKLMGKPDRSVLLEFKRLFDQCTCKMDQKPFLTYYLMAAHPGCRHGDMKELRQFIDKYLKIRPRQVQIFTPTPSTFSSLMYYTGQDPFSGRKLFVEKNPRLKEAQKTLITGKRN
jgi:uncharacterized radical SAM protein YgiQ